MDKVILYNKSKSGKLQSNTIWVVENSNGTASIYRETGYIGMKMKVNEKIITKGTNIGKKNELTPYKLAINKSKKIIKDKIEDNWVLDIADAGTITYIKPMLAETYDPLSDDVKFPCMVQPKLNGCRCVSYLHLNDDRMLSRENNEFSSMNHIKNHIKKYFKEYSPDGELYSHGDDFEDIISWVKKYQEGFSEKISYWIYDLAIPNLTFEERNGILKDIFRDMCVGGVPFYYVHSYYAYSKEDIKKFHDEFVADGFEGIIIRDPNSLYDFNERSIFLFKWKNFIDSEFKIIGYKSEIWHDTINNVHHHLIMFICENEDGVPFDVRPKGKFSKRIADYLIGDTFIGKMYTVRYQNLSAKDNTPIFGVGIICRDYE